MKVLNNGLFSFLLVTLFVHGLEAQSVDVTLPVVWTEIINANFSLPLEELAKLGFKIDNTEIVSCGNEGKLLHSRDQSPIRWSGRNLPPFSRVRINLRVAFLDYWDDSESMWLTVNNAEVWRQQSSWRSHGFITCLGPLSDKFTDVTTEVGVSSGTSSLDVVLSANLQSSVDVESMGITKFQIQVVQSNDTAPQQDGACAYTIENDIWYEIKSVDFKPNQQVILTCANGKQVVCKDWFNRYACQVPKADCPAPRNINIDGKCCSLGKSCTDTTNAPQSQPVSQEKCEYLFNKADDPSFVDLKISDMTKTVQIECADGTLFKCTANLWGKYTCLFGTDKTCQEPRNALINGQCCNLGKGCIQIAPLATNVSLEDTTGTSASNRTPASTLVSVVFICGTVSVAAVLLGAYFYRKSRSTRMARLP